MKVAATLVFALIITSAQPGFSATGYASKYAGKLGAGAFVRGSCNRTEFTIAQATVSLGLGVGATLAATYHLTGCGAAIVEQRRYQLVAATLEGDAFTANFVDRDRHAAAAGVVDPPNERVTLYGKVAGDSLTGTFVFCKPERSGRRCETAVVVPQRFDRV